jgi:hypothetical protein
MHVMRRETSKKSLHKKRSHNFHNGKKGRFNLFHFEGSLSKELHILPPTPLSPITMLFPNSTSLATSRFVLTLWLALAAVTTMPGRHTLVVLAQDPPTCEEALQERLDCYDTDGPCETLPIPASAFGPPVDPAKGYVIQKLRRGVHAIGDGAYWMMVAVSPQKKSSIRSASSKYDVAIFDFPEGNFVVRDGTGQVTGSLITAALDELLFEDIGLTREMVTDVTFVYSHQHMDHIGAATIVYDHVVGNWEPENVEIVGHANVKEEFDERSKAEFYSFRAPVPTKLVNDDPEVLQVGYLFNFSLTPVMGHSNDKDLVIFLKRDTEAGAPAVMMYVDVVFPGWAPFFSFAITTDIFKYLESHKILMDDFDLGDDGVFIGGHLSKLGNYEDIVMSYDFAQTVMDGALMGLQQADYGALVAASGVGDPSSRNLGNAWLLFEVYFNEVVKICSKHVVAEWGCKLGAVDVVVGSHCRSAQSYWRVDY